MVTNIASTLQHASDNRIFKIFPVHLLPDSKHLILHTSWNYIHSLLFRLSMGVIGRKQNRWPLIFRNTH